MKKIFFSILGIILLLFACKKDEDCNAGSLANNLIGEWTLNVGGTALGDVEFNANGTLIDPDSILINPDPGTGEILDILTYEVMGDTGFTAWATNAADLVHVYSDYTVSSYTCDEIVLDNFSVDVTLNRK